jgi:hypothetical protein
LHSINSDSESEVEILESEDSIFIGDIDAFETLIRKKILLIRRNKRNNRGRVKAR